MMALTPYLNQLYSKPPCCFLPYRWWNTTGRLRMGLRTIPIPRKRLENKQHLPFDTTKTPFQLPPHTLKGPKIDNILLVQPNHRWPNTTLIIPRDIKRQAPLLFSVRWTTGYTNSASILNGYMSMINKSRTPIAEGQIIKYKFTPITINTLALVIN